MSQKAGYKTTEFWVSLIVIIVGALIDSGAFGEPFARGGSSLVAALTAWRYNERRVDLKKGNP